MSKNPLASGHINYYFVHWAIQGPLLVSVFGTEESESIIKMVAFFIKLLLVTYEYSIQANIKLSFVSSS